MKLVIEYVKNATVKSGEKTNKIGEGLLVYVGVMQDDIERPEVLDKVAKKLANLRIISDENGKIDKSLKDTNGQILLISNFTLGGRNSKGNKLDFLHSANFEEAKEIFGKLVNELEKYELAVKTGFFGEHMEVSHTKLGPLTYFLEF
ncbi:D-aminoacyl-tRNA deacylase [Candidatus Absconditicoccus praedator]|uniref:D-aminoacyl-tRNA deacylase n=1 Tax=Candidatus Absconditicoccus praedator TaxID=2735562 RepID=UPI001E5F942A|nr:D-aminoacyl-tRNA deacylase [Candidatus Absconditicoccus praedator]UFX82947.1 D-tyrosyl-tRNA(Tyr) deacylase [Candidatus Absconditicoccus praedator]